MFQLVCGSSRLVSVSRGREGGGEWRGREGESGKGGKEKGREGGRERGKDAERERREEERVEGKERVIAIHPVQEQLCGAHQVHIIHIKPTNQEENILTKLFNVFVKWTKLLGKPVYQF